MIVAVDGPSAAGKSTVARAVADALGLPYLDTGSTYRAVTWAVLDRGVDPADAAACSEVAATAEIVILGPGRVAVDGRDVSKEIRGPAVTSAVSTVSAHPEVRRRMADFQRRYAAHGGVVEGRDVGTVVFPDAEVKVFLTASPEERARRRGVEAGEQAAADLSRRDSADSTRAVSPLKPADDALVIDTTDRDPDEVAAAVVALARHRSGRIG